ncbi:MAG: hypothetical protein PHQ45_00995 [Acidaminococcaceae bacterium]|nr:hypothetical protein [Acidaminococcaceae bacterium]
MTMRQVPWLEGPSLYQYVEKNINKEGIFAPTTLPDTHVIFPDPALTLELGAPDAYFAMSTQEDNKLMTAAVYQELKTFMENPSDEQRDILYKIVCSARCIAYCESLIDMLQSEELPPVLMNLAEDWLHHASNREAVKFAIILCGLCNVKIMSSILHQEIKKDLLLLALCDEFTFFVIFALDISGASTQRDIWQIIYKTTGWGRVHALESAQFDTAVKKNWLLCHGSELNVDYPGISLLCIKEGHMLRALRRAHIERALYLGCLNTINNFLVFVLETAPGDEDEVLYTELRPAELIQEILRHAQEYAHTITDMIGIINLASALKELAERSRWDAIEPNACHLLISQAEKTIFYKNWMPDINAQLLQHDNTVNYRIADFAQAVHIDITTTLFRLLKQNPQDTQLYNYLLLDSKPRLFARVLSFAREHLHQYRLEEDDMQPIIASLYTHPGQGVDFIIAGLTSIYDRPRANALGALEQWGLEYITPSIKVALLKAQNMAQHNLQRMRIDALLHNRVLDMEESLSKLFSKELPR